MNEGPSRAALRTLGASSHPWWRWAFWSLLPWRCVYSVHTFSAPYQGEWESTEFRPDLARAMRLAARYMIDGRGYVVVCARVAPWRPGCAMREVAAQTWLTDWPWRVVLSVELR